MARTPAALMDLTRVYTPDDISISGIDSRTIVPRLQGMPVSRSMLGTSTLTLRLADRVDGRTYELLTGSRALDVWDDDGRVRGDIDVTIHDPDGDVPFVLREIAKTETGVELVCYDANIAALTGHHGPLSAYRDSQTRAAFIESLCRRAGVPAFVPERNITQPIKDFSKDDQRTLTTADRVRRKDRSQPSEVKRWEQQDGQIGGDVTRSSFARSLLAALDAPATVRNLKALMGWMAAEGGAGPQWGIPNNTADYNPLNTTQNMPGAGDTGVQGNISSYTSWQQGLDATVKTIRDGWSQYGYGAIVRALQNEASLSEIATAIDNSSWLAGAYPNLLGLMQQASPEEGGGIVTSKRGGSTTYDVAVVERYEFRVGRQEDFLQAGRRLADEVRFRFFSTLSRMVYASDPALASQPVSMRLREGTDGVDRILWRATRKRRVDEMTVTARTVPWEAPPGTVVDVLGERPEGKPREDGSEWPWLVREVSRDLMDPSGTATIRLGQPQKPRKEPAPTVSSGSRTLAGDTRTPDGTPEPIARAYAEAVKIAQRRDTYTYGGGHDANATPPHDCSGYVSRVLIAGGMLDSATDTVGLGSWGSAGRGKYLTIWVKPYAGMSGHTFMEFNLPGKDTEWFEAGGGQSTNGRRDSKSTVGYEARRPALGA